MNKKPTLNRFDKPTVWAIGATDNTGGAGLLADQQALTYFGLHTCPVVTGVTAQSHRGVHALEVIKPTLFVEQLHSLLDTYPPLAIKLGALLNQDIIDALIAFLPLVDCPVVADPVLHASQGGLPLANRDNYLALLPLIDVLTPNLKETQALFADNYSPVLPSNHSEAFAHSLDAICKHYTMNLVVTGIPNVLLVANSNKDDVKDLCVLPDGLITKRMGLSQPKVDTNYHHGTGCRFASAVAANLALGESMEDACVLANTYIHKGLAQQANPKTKEDASTPKKTKDISYWPWQQANTPFVVNDLPTVNLRWNPAVEYTKPARVNFTRIKTASMTVYPVVDSFNWVAHCITSGATTVQLRLKDENEHDLEETISRACQFAREHNAQLFINDYWHLAIKHGAFGVHLGQEDVDTADLSAIANSGLRLGLSTHCWAEFARAVQLNPSYLAVGPIYPTTTKTMVFAPQGLARLKALADCLAGALPLVAIGGIDTSNAQQVVAAGANSVAVVRTITEANPEKTRRIINQLQTAVNGD